jgi:hypothetical protein
MSHDFLSSLHSSVIGTSDEKVSPKLQAAAQGSKEESEKAPPPADDRHRTVGVSMSPQLRERAVQRARALGLPFSRYVQWCVEAELGGSSLSDRFKL